ncbi:MAG: DUF4038 domain-containing protein, partial [Bacteroidota bacterium]
MNGDFPVKNKIFLCCKFSLLSIIVILIALSSVSQTTYPFPLKISDDKKYLVDKNNKPFLVKEISAWGLIQSLSEKDEAAFLDSIIKKGFNTVLTCILIKHSQMTGNPPDWQGVSPLNIKWDFSTPNPVYFEH